MKEYEVKFLIERRPCRSYLAFVDAEVEVGYSEIGRAESINCWDAFIKALSDIDWPNTEEL